MREGFADQNALFQSILKDPHSVDVTNIMASDPTSMTKFMVQYPNVADGLLSSHPAAAAKLLEQHPEALDSIIKTSVTPITNLLKTYPKTSLSVLNKYPDEYSSMVFNTPDVAKDLIITNPSEVSLLMKNYPNAAYSIMTSHPDKAASLIKKHPDAIHSVIQTHPEAVTKLMKEYPSIMDSVMTVNPKIQAKGSSPSVIIQTSPPTIVNKVSEEPQTNYLSTAAAGLIGSAAGGFLGSMAATNMVRGNDMPMNTHYNSAIDGKDMYVAEWTRGGESPQRNTKPSTLVKEHNSVDDHILDKKTGYVVPDNLASVDPQSERKKNECIHRKQRNRCGKCCDYGDRSPKSTSSAEDECPQSSKYPIDFDNEMV